jgi:hypothetical protein
MLSTMSTKWFSFLVAVSKPALAPASALRLRDAVGAVLDFLGAAFTVLEELFFDDERFLTPVARPATVGRFFLTERRFAMAHFSYTFWISAPPGRVPRGSSL